MEAARPGPATFRQFISALIGSEHPALWAKLRKVSLPGGGLDRMIDDATGYTDRTAQLYLRDALDLWDRLPRGEIDESSVPPGLRAAVEQGHPHTNPETAP
jgi:hypothetical protein